LSTVRPHERPLDVAEVLQDELYARKRGALLNDNTTPEILAGIPAEFFSAVRAHACGFRLNPLR
jgi:hypothetical protein